MAYGEFSKCGRKTALSTFFAVTFIAFTLSTIALISPSWQYVYLENGRTEHHHGLWLDCKRDYSFDYGRTREYYETLYRRDLQGSPFDIFFLPPLQCVYKFDYYIDPEDLYDHNHDENRIQNDAYQHLFLGWKIAALCGCGLALVFSASALLLAICAFCYRTFICASTVLVSIAGTPVSFFKFIRYVIVSEFEKEKNLFITAILSTIGVAVFYAWANYQDNKVIKEDEDTIYEQMLGWAFYCQIVTTVIHWLASMLGCCVTSVSLSKTRAKLVKIEVVDGNDDMELLSSKSASTQPFKRSFSAIYRVDSKSLRQWEREYMRNAREKPQRTDEEPFKRTASVPNFLRKQGNLKEPRKKQYQHKRSQDAFSSASNITETTRSGSMNTLEMVNQSRNTVSAVVSPTQNVTAPALPALPKLKSALKTPQTSRKNVSIDDGDVTYEYLPCDGSIAVSSLLGGRSTSSQRTYDPIYERIGQDSYLEPTSRRCRSVTPLDVGQIKKSFLPTQPLTGSSQSVSTGQKKSTIINDVVRPSLSSDILNGVVGRNQCMSYNTVEQAAHKNNMSLNEEVPLIDKRSKQSIRNFGLSLLPENGYCDIKSVCDSKTTSGTYRDTRDAEHLQHCETKSPSRYTDVKMSSSERFKESSSIPRNPGNNEPSDEISMPHSGIAINTFGEREKQSSVTNLTFRPQTATCAAELFERPDSLTLNSPSVTFSTSRNPKLLPPRVTRRGLLTVLPDEVDRSIGSSTLLESDALRDDDGDSYVADAEIRLNLFMKDVPKDETTV